MRMLTISLALAVSACSTAEATPSAPPSTEARKVEAFHGLNLTAVVGVEVAIGTTPKLEVIAPAEWIPRLQTKVINGILVVSMPGSWKNVPEIKVAITMPDLTSIDISGVASVHAARLATKALDVMISGTGSVDLAGTVETLKVSSAGTGSIAAKELKAATVSMELGGTGEAVVTATKRIDATISGTGAITVYGKPATVNKSITGVGDVELR
jgi:hypothetical protein